MKRKMTLLVLLMPLWQVAGQLPDAGQIMDKSRELTVTQSLTAEVTLIITEKNGAVRSRTILMTTKSYPDGTEKRFIRFTQPSDVMGTTMLVVDNKTSPDEMWIYLPALKKIRRIVSSEKGKSFMSSEFSNDDMSSPALADFSYRHLDKSGDNNLWIIESTPADDKKAEEYGFSRKVSYISSGKSQIQKMEYYNFDNKLFKIIQIRSIYLLSNGRYLVRDMTVDNLMTGRKSEISFNKISEGSKVDDSFFSLHNLER